MIHKIGNLWEHTEGTDYIIATGNSYLRTDGAVVMGRGMARDMLTRFPNTARVFGARIPAHLG